MNLTGLLDILTASDDFRSLWRLLNEAPETKPSSQNIVRSARAFMVAALAHTLQRPVLVITARVERAYDIAEQIPVWLPETPVLRFQEPTAMFYDRTPWTSSVIRARLQTLAALSTPVTPSHFVTASNIMPVVVTSAYALMQKTMPVRDFQGGNRVYRAGQAINQETLLRTWQTLGYEAASVVVEPGTFSRRGGIVDVFPVALDYPVRIEFFGDEIESLRYFDPHSQRSTDGLKAFVLTPAREVLPKYMPEVASRLVGWFAKQPDSQEDPTSAVPDYGPLENSALFPQAEFYLPFFYQPAASLLDYLPENALVLVEDWLELKDTIGELEEQALGLREDYLSANKIPPQMPVAYHTWDDLHEAIDTRHTLYLGYSERYYDGSELEVSSARRLGDLFAPGPRYGGQLKLFLDELQKGQHTLSQTVVVTRQAQRLAELWSEQEEVIFPVTQISSLQDIKTLNFVEGSLAEGWIFYGENGNTLHLFTDAEIFGWKRPEPRRRIQQRPQSPESYFADLADGDYVVHIDHGIGLFRGVHRRVLDNTEREYLLVEYGGGDMLYVPIHQADRLSRYVGGETVSPQLNRLGSPDWGRTKNRTRQAVQEAAEELLELYAARSVVKGYAFSPDTAWQHELEASFPYVETEDQLKALRDVKQDMEMPRPMDRLICGDVGYGKTEVALRAAFKAVTDGKQVAVLVPTTVLAQQHYNSFSQRLTAFPVNVQMLSRFRTPKEQQDILSDLKEGKTDIIIGTHRLLQDDVDFKDLGLLVIDEEQRFGVTHKEMLKKKRTEVDVLTMTATPIPRTLYMGLTGVRDISLIQIAPQERLPVVTHVGIYDEKLVRQAILREIDRGGQVFFVHNRVQTIASFTHRLRALVPEAKFIIGHGQMPGHQLEEIMTAFVDGQYDVLVSTTIIENGVDIPNVNTIIVDRADIFGLSPLYQLRGRVGRAAQQAFAYFFHARDHTLTPEARARLETIAEYTELGSGMSIAIRDLEIRGMGDLLGLRQSGHIEAVGFHLYTQLLAEAVQSARSKGKLPALEEALEMSDVPSSSLTIDLPIPAYLPTDYVSEMNLRIQLYRRLASIDNEQEVEAMEAELRDRFGSLPKAVEGLLMQIRVKLAAQAAGVTAIASENGRLFIRLPYLGSIDRAALQSYLGDKVRVSRIALWLAPEIGEEGWRPVLLEILHRLSREVMTGLLFVEQESKQEQSVEP